MAGEPAGKFGGSQVLRIRAFEIFQIKECGINKTGQKFAFEIAVSVMMGVAGHSFTEDNRSFNNLSLFARSLLRRSFAFKSSASQFSDESMCSVRRVFRKYVAYFDVGLFVSYIR
jgi:hypothetical protein